ncbi:hypothetical protein E4U41_002649 [Claviceps citrina]|nr:hypothetical protein E4U41_002649 [Claviceps citrina]
MCEVGRFDGRGPHHAADADDDPVNLVPCGGASCLRWSPWLVTGPEPEPEHRTATLAYVAKNYVGFRRVTLQGPWPRGQDPAVRVDGSDSLSICLFLSADAFVEWENAIWHEGDSRLARGIIATPFAVKPFQVDLCAAEQSPPTGAHSPEECRTLYPQPEDVSTNPITGKSLRSPNTLLLPTDLIIHHPDPSDKPPEPLYSLVRLSATPTNQDWYQTNVPASPHEQQLPQWAERIRRALGRQVPRVDALGGVDDSESDTDSEFDEPEVDMSILASHGEEEHQHQHQHLLSKAQLQVQVHPHRFRLWGMAASPGGSCTAALVSKHVTQHSDRRPRSRVLFSWPASAPSASSPRGAACTALTTEGTVWESTYGNTVEMPASLSGPATDRLWPLLPDTPLRRQFRDVVSRQTCVFCHTSLVTMGNESTCEKGHSFATCAATGLAILAPGISRVCSLCSLRCLNRSELSRIAARHIGPHAVVVPPSRGHGGEEACGGCGGKFLI